MDDFSNNAEKEDSIFYDYLKHPIGKLVSFRQSTKFKLKFILKNLIRGW